MFRYVAGGRGRQLRPVLVPGNLVEAELHWRSESQLPTARLELTRLLDLEVRRLSAGQRRRLSLARLLAAPRALWLLDEPLSPLDADWRARFGEIMGEHLAGGGLIVAAVHDPLPITALSVEIGETAP